MRARTAEDAQLLEMLDPVAAAAGYEIVRLRLMAGNETASEGFAPGQTGSSAMPRNTHRCIHPRGV